jgi:hypothetical protein
VHDAQLSLTITWVEDHQTNERTYRMGAQARSTNWTRSWQEAISHGMSFQTDVLCSHRLYTSSASGAILTDGGVQRRVKFQLGLPPPAALGPCGLRARVSILLRSIHFTTTPQFFLTFLTPFPCRVPDGPPICTVLVLSFPPPRALAANRYLE